MLRKETLIGKKGSVHNQIISYDNCNDTDCIFFYFSEAFLFSPFCLQKFSYFSYFVLLRTKTSK